MGLINPVNQTISVKLEVVVLLGGDTIHSLTLPVLLYQGPIGQKYNITDTGYEVNTGGKGLWSQYRREGVMESIQEGRG